MQPDRADRLRTLRHELDERLRELLGEQTSERLATIARDAVLGPGQRLRPLLLLLTTQECGGPLRQALDVACALEMVHSASLVIDDLPAMDDAYERRGKPAVHRVHGQAGALLGAIALLAHAFAVVARLPGADAAQRTAVSGLLARLIDTLVSGQLDELQAAPRPASAQAPRDPMLLRTPAALPLEARQQALEEVTRRKTAAVFVAAVEMAAALTPHEVAQRRALMRFAEHLGQAYQIHDDLRDADEDVGRETFATVLGRPAAQALLHRHLAAARAHLARPDGALGSFAAALFIDAWAHAT